MSQNYDLIARYYDIDMGRNQPFDDASFMFDLLTSAPGSVLELGCGNGRVLKRLLATGQALTGLDCSREMLRMAREALPREVTLVLGDMRAIPLAQRFDWVLLPYSLVTYLTGEDDWLRFAASLKRVIGDGSRVVFDCFVPHDELADGNWREDYQREWCDGLLCRSRRISALEDGCNCIERSYRYLPRSRPAEAFAFTTSEKIRPYTVEALTDRLQSLGLRLQDPVFDYGTQACPGKAQFFTLIAEA
jgi:SAM-dependent methyltransferase